MYSLYNQKRNKKTRKYNKIGLYLLVLVIVLIFLSTSNNHNNITIEEDTKQEDLFSKINFSGDFNLELDTTSKTNTKKFNNFINSIDPNIKVLLGNYIKLGLTFDSRTKCSNLILKTNNTENIYNFLKEKIPLENGNYKSGSGDNIFSLNIENRSGYLFFESVKGKLMCPKNNITPQKKDTLVKLKKENSIGYFFFDNKYGNQSGNFYLDDNSLHTEGIISSKLFEKSTNKKINTKLANISPDSSYAFLEMNNIPKTILRDLFNSDLFNKIFLYSNLDTLVLSESLENSNIQITKDNTKSFYRAEFDTIEDSKYTSIINKNIKETAKLFSAGNLISINRQNIYDDIDLEKGLSINIKDSLKQKIKDIDLPNQIKWKYENDLGLLEIINQENYSKNYLSKSDYFNKNFKTGNLIFSFIMNLENFRNKLIQDINQNKNSFLKCKKEIPKNSTFSIVSGAEITSLGNDPSYIQSGGIIYKSRMDPICKEDSFSWMNKITKFTSFAKKIEDNIYFEIDIETKN